MGIEQYSQACSCFHRILFNNMLFFTYIQVQKLQCVPNLPSTEGTQEKTQKSPSNGKLRTCTNLFKAIK